MAGLATRVEKEGGGRYLVGLWERFLIHDLCWKVAAASKQFDELSGIPSWSWASVAGSFFYSTQSGGDHITCTVVNIDCMPQIPSYIGYLDHGIITLRGWAADAFISQRPGWTENQCWYECQIEDQDHNLVNELIYFNPDLQRWAERMKEGEPVRLLEMMRDGKKEESWYLVLQGTGKNPNVCKRVGLLELRRDDHESWFDDAPKTPQTYLIDCFRSVAVLTEVSIQ